MEHRIALFWRQIESVIYVQNIQSTLDDGDYSQLIHPAVTMETWQATARRERQLFGNENVHSLRRLACGKENNQSIK